MATAIIDTLKAKDSSGNEVEVYPRTSFRAVKNDEGKTLNAVLEGVVFVETSDDESIRALKSKDSSGNEAYIFPKTAFKAVENDEGQTLSEALDSIEERLTSLESSATQISSIMTTEKF